AVKETGALSRFFADILQQDTRAAPSPTKRPFRKLGGRKSVAVIAPTRTRTDGDPLRGCAAWRRRARRARRRSGHRIHVFMTPSPRPSRSNRRCRRERVAGRGLGADRLPSAVACQVAFRG